MASPSPWEAQLGAIKQVWQDYMVMAHNWPYQYMDKERFLEAADDYGRQCDDEGYRRGRREGLEAAIEILGNEPLGYRTEDEHTKLEAYSDRCELRIRSMLAELDRECHEFVEPVIRCADCGKELKAGDKHEKCTARDRANRRIARVRKCEL
jgi:hypothetical protein